MKTKKLILGIIATIVSALVLLASIAVTALGNGVDGLIGLLVGAFMLTAGISDIATRKTIDGTKICGILFLIAGITGVLLSKIHSGLEFCSIISVFFGIANFILLKRYSAEAETKENEAEKSETEGKEATEEQKGKNTPKIFRTIVMTIFITVAIIIALGVFVVFMAANTSSEKDKNGNRSNSENEQQNVELEETGCFVRLNYIDSFQVTSNDTVYIRYVGFVKNPNQSLCAEFPTLAVTVKNKDGVVIATGEATKNRIQPGDCVPITGEISVDLEALDDGCMVNYQISCSRYTKSDSDNKGVKTTDFTIENISERASGDTSIVTGEVTNNSNSDCSMSEIVLIMRNKGDIVYINKTYMYNLSQTQTRAFEFKKYGDWPEHDETQVIVNTPM